MQGCNNVPGLLEQPCAKSDNINKVVSSGEQLVPKLWTTWDKQSERYMLTGLQACYNLCDAYASAFFNSIYFSRNVN